MSENTLSPRSAPKNFFRRITQPFWLISIAAIFASFGVYYMLNHTIMPENAHAIYCKLDDYIPFNEWMALPYVYWFGFIPAGIVQVCWHRDDGRTNARRDFWRFTALLYLGWYISLLCFIIYPSTITFRPTPDEIGFDNFCAAGLSLTYSGFDEPVNVLPSLHCTSTLAVSIGILRSDFVKESRFKWIYYLYYVTICTLICAATVVVKQHSIIDVFAALGLMAVLYVLVYVVKWDKQGIKAALDKLRKQLTKQES